MHINKSLRYVIFFMKESKPIQKYIDKEFDPLTFSFFLHQGGKIVHFAIIHAK